MILSHIVHVLCAWRRYHACMLELSKLSNHELTDIGITRSGIMAVAWRSAQDYIARKEGQPIADASRDIRTR